MHGRGIPGARFWTASLAAAVVGLGGCGGPDRPTTIPISGRVTINGQPPGEFGKLFFTPIEAAAGYSMRPASGSFDSQGVYRVMSWEPDDGLVPGRYTVNVMPADPARTKIPERYRDSGTSGLEVEVPVDKDTIAFDVSLTSP